MDDTKQGGAVEIPPTPEKPKVVFTREVAQKKPNPVIKAAKVKRDRAAERERAKAKMALKEKTEVKTKVEPKTKAKSKAKVESKVFTSPVGESPVFVENYAMKDIVIPEKWNRTEARNIKELAAAIAARGQHVPLLLVLDADGKTVLREGRRRYLARQSLGLSTAPVLIVKADSEKDQDLMSLETNVCREAHTTYELVMQCSNLANQGVSIADIAKALGRTASNISQHMLAFKHDPRLLAALEKDTIPLIAFRIINKLNREADATFYEKIVTALLAGSTVAAVEAQVEKYLAAKADKKVKAAEAEGKKAPEVKRVGGAAHKKNKRDIKTYDYTDLEVQRASRLLSKSCILTTAADWVDMLRRTTTKDKTKFMEGALWAVDYVLGLREE